MIEKFILKPKEELKEAIYQGIKDGKFKVVTTNDDGLGLTVLNSYSFINKVDCNSIRENPPELFDKIPEPKFKVGDRVRFIECVYKGTRICGTVDLYNDNLEMRIHWEDDMYTTNYLWKFERQDEFELAPERSTKRMLVTFDEIKKGDIVLRAQSQFEIEREVEE